MSTLVIGLILFCIGIVFGLMINMSNYNGTLVYTDIIDRFIYKDTVTIKISPTLHRTFSKNMSVYQVIAAYQLFSNYPTGRMAINTAISQFCNYEVPDILIENG